MSTDHRLELSGIKRFDQLVAYLRDEMRWPIEGEDFEDLTFDYTPDELGIDAANAAKIQEIKRLRPLTADQPWGIFFIKFEPKRLPVVALRRILSRVVLKKRAAANSAERAAWDMADLLFISNYGDDTERRMSFAHFVQEDDWGDLPTLKILGWDGDDTNLHLDHVAHELTTKLRWPDDEADITGWRDAWASAFTLRNRQVITTAKHLAERLADLARKTRLKANAALAIESSTGPLRTLMDAFKKALLHDLDDDGFADMYAQTIAYGLLSARISRPAGLTADNMADMVPVTNPFLKEMLESFLRLGGRRRSGKGWTGIDFDELGINEIVQLLREANMEAVLRDFGDRNPEEDPVIHFYESFLREYDANIRMKRGVFYTPRPVVSYIVRSVHELLQTEFGLTDGLADTTTWGEMLDKHAGLELPLLSDSPGETQTISPDEPFVQILDPATGTATFLVEVIEVIYATLTAKWKQQRLSEAQRIEAWNEYVPTHLLPRLHAYELMMAPYAIAHMKIGLKLAETRYRFESEERARIYLTNALEPWVKQLPLIGFDALAHEATAVNAIKRHKRFTVVIGNPPYSKNSGNRGEAAEMLVQSYKDLVAGETNVQPLSDDYVKFIAYALHASVNESSIVGMITNRSFLDGLIHRGMRKSLLACCSEIFVIDLHGDSNVGENIPHGRSNENVFDITQGVAISLLVRSAHPEPVNAVKHLDVWGTRTEKYEALADSISLTNSLLMTDAPYFFFVPKELVSQSEQVGWISVEKLFGIGGMGVKSRRDHFLLDRDRTVLQQRFQSLAETGDIDAARKIFGVTDNEQWTLRKMRDLVRRIGVEHGIQPILYRPFDTHYIWYHREAIERGDSRWPVMKHVVPNRLSLLTSRQSKNAHFTSVFIARGLSEMKTAESTRGSYVFPLFAAPDQGDILSAAQASANMRTELMAEHLKNKTLIEVLGYVYAVFHSPNYRVRYSGALQIEFPRVPSECPIKLFDSLSRIGSELVALHLLESSTLDHPITDFIGNQNREVVKPSWSHDTVWLDKRKTTGFQGVPEAVWNFHIGGYQVCHKWLKDRKGRTLSDEDIAHYHKIVVALSETIRLMREIDEVIDQHGGWPEAFAASDAAVTGDAVQ